MPGTRLPNSVLGPVSVTAGLSVLVYALVDATSAGWGSFQTIGLLTLSAALLGAFVALLAFAFRRREEVEVSAVEIARFDRAHPAEVTP